MHLQEAGSDHPIDRASRALALRSLRRYAVRSPVVLETGSGAGDFLCELRAALPAAAVIGSDYLPALVERLGTRVEGVPLLQFDLQRCPLPSGSVDGVVALNVLEHIPDDAVALRELARVLKPGGVLHLEVPSGPELYDLYDDLLGHCRRYRMSEFCRKVESAGLLVVELQHLGCLVFPFFRWVKMRNRQRQASLGAAEREALVRCAIRGTRASPAVRAAFALERIIGRSVRFPTGIRCVVVARKPLVAGDRT
jgi:SAM-dependent methyltransferase